MDDSPKSRLASLLMYGPESANIEDRRYFDPTMVQHNLRQRRLEAVNSQASDAHNRELARALNFGAAAAWPEPPHDWHSIPGQQAPIFPQDILLRLIRGN